MPLQLKKVKPPVGLATGDISGIQVLLDFIPTGAKLHGGAIMALVHILVNIFECFDGGDRLYIDVAAILPDKIWGVADHPSIVNLHIIFDSMSPKGIASPGACIRVL
jgi:hypothetical protein